MSGRPFLLDWPPASNRRHCSATEGNQVLSKSASLPAQPFEEFDSSTKESANATAAWKQEVNQRLAAHRNRRGGPQGDAGGPAENPRTASARAAEAAARVAARYAKAPSYSQLLAGEARAAVRAAGAAAEAARNAQAAAEAVLAGLESGPRPALWEQEMQDSRMDLRPSAPQVHAAPARWQDEPPVSANSEPVPANTLQPWAGAQPRWEEALPVTAPAPQGGRDVWSDMRVHPSPEPQYEYAGRSESQYRREQVREQDETGLFPYDSAEAFNEFDSHDPMGSATVEPVQHLPANLIEFPRELVATRKARPRLSEGPYYNAPQESSQLSIFEVDPELLAPPVHLSEPAVEEVAPPEWASIELDHLDEDVDLHSSDAAESHQVYVQHDYAAVAEAQSRYIQDSQTTGVAVEEMPAEAEVIPAVPPQVNKAYQSVAEREPAAELVVARVSDRLLAAIVDGALVTLAVVAAAVVVIASTAHPPTGRIALIATGFGLLLFGLLYQFLFLSFAEEGTPGMRYARIALCTFDDDNPTAEQMRMRIPAALLSALPAGLGLIWAIFDRDHLTWHDRMTRTYQRKY